MITDQVEPNEIGNVRNTKMIEMIKCEVEEAELDILRNDQFFEFVPIKVPNQYIWILVKMQIR